MSLSKFSFEIAEVIFGEDTASVCAPMEDAMVRRFRVWIDQTTRANIHARCALIDRELVARLSASNMLEVARMIEDRCPEVIQNMPVLSRHLKALQKAYELAQVFMPSNMEMLGRALEEEGSR